MSDLKIKDSGNWVIPREAHMKQSGSWIPIQSIWRKDGSTWRRHWPNQGVVTYGMSAGTATSIQTGSIITGPDYGVDTGEMTIPTDTNGNISGIKQIVRTSLSRKYDFTDGMVWGGTSTINYGGVGTITTPYRVVDWQQVKDIYNLYAIYATCSTNLPGTWEMRDPLWTTVSSNNNEQYDTGWFGVTIPNGRWLTGVRFSAHWGGGDASLAGPGNADMGGSYHNYTVQVRTHTLYNVTSGIYYGSSLDGLTSTTSTDSGGTTETHWAYGWTSPNRKIENLEYKFSLSFTGDDAILLDSITNGVGIRIHTVPGDIYT